MTVHGGARSARVVVGALAVLVLGAAGLVTWGLLAGEGSGHPPPSSAWAQGDDVVVEGEVVENSADACREPVEPNKCIEDGGDWLELAVDRERVTVEYSHGEWPPCDNVEAAQAARAARVGDVVEVHARVDRLDASVVLSTCDAQEYFVKQR